jgi:hypothetical protein
LAACTAVPENTLRIQSASFASHHARGAHDYT